MSKIKVTIKTIFVICCSLIPRLAVIHCFIIYNLKQLMQQTRGRIVILNLPFNSFTHSIILNAYLTSPSFYELIQTLIVESNIRMRMFQRLNYALVQIILLSIHIEQMKYLTGIIIGACAVHFAPRVVIEVPKLLMVDVMCQSQLLPERRLHPVVISIVKRECFADISDINICTFLYYRNEQ